jgi:predicted anti-sigma-YlaC factor YlaD
LNPLLCDEVVVLAPELALGVLDGSERARVLSHLENCETCRRLVDDLATTIGRVVAAAPGIDPPPGFDRQVLAHLAPLALKQPARRRRRGLFAGLAAVAVAVSLSLAGFLVASGGDSGPLTRRATITAAGDWARGDVLLVDAHPTWVTMRVTVDYEANDLHCELALADGRTVRLGTFHEVGGAWEWGGTIQAAASDVVEARLVSADGTVVASGRFD